MHESNTFVAGILDNSFDAGIIDLAQGYIERRRLGLDARGEGVAHSKKGCTDANKTHLAGVKVP